MTKNKSPRNRLTAAERLEETIPLMQRIAGQLFGEGHAESAAHTLLAIAALKEAEALLHSEQKEAEPSDTPPL